MFISWYKSIKKFLKDEPELWLAYPYGQQLDNIPQLLESELHHRGLPTQLLKFSYTLMRTWRPFTSNGVPQDGSFFVFAGTSNQMDSLDSTIDTLKEKGAVVNVITHKGLLNGREQKERYIPLAFSSSDVLKALLLVMVRGPFLYRELKDLHPQAVNNWFDTFCSIYVYLAYFHRVLSKTKPRFVITANDHSITNRCMLTVAHQLGIETVYLQHASVTNIFPALRVNYAFLDGQCALDTYLQCEENQPNTDRQVPLPKVFLSGQKKSIANSAKQGIKSIGIAINPLDNIDIAIEFANQLAALEHHITIRWHPRQSEYDITKCRDAFAKNKDITLSDPKIEKVGDFLSRIIWLIAGNSSIHLEAALANVTSIYYELTPAHIYDYYGYVKNGLAIKADSVLQISNLIKDGISINDNAIDFIRYYSATYKTDWDGLEGQLVAEVLESYGENKPPPIKPLDYRDLLV